MSINEVIITALSELVPHISVSENPSDDKKAGKRCPDTFLVIIPVFDKLLMSADDVPTMQSEEVELALYTKGNYLALRDRITKRLVKAGVSVLQRHYEEYEDETGYHHYTFDLELAQEIEMEDE